MFKNYLTVAIRNLLRHKVYSLINISGLAMGLGCVILMGLYIQHEWQYDQQHPLRDQTYRVLRETTLSDGKSEFAGRTSGALATALQQDIPEIETATRVLRREAWVQAGEKGFDHVFCLADPTILDLFHLPLALGNRESATQQPASVVITETMANKLYGHENPIGKTLQIEESNLGETYTVVGVLKDMPTQSTMRFDIMAFGSTTHKKHWCWDTWQPTNWRYVETYIVLPHTVVIPDLEHKISNLIETYMGPDIQKANTYHLQPLKDIYLYSKQDYDLTRLASINIYPNYGDIATLYGAGAISLFILLIACINFMNLTTARSTTRIREVGMRKVVGAHRSQLMTQFIGEAILLSLTALMLAIILVQLTLPTFNTFIEKNLTLSSSLSQLLPALFILTLCVGFFAGSYPALYLSRFSPITIFKGTSKTSAATLWVRKGLVVFQFAISVILIVGAITVTNQLSYIRHKDLGFDKELVVSTPIFWTVKTMTTWGRKGVELRKRYNMVKQEFLKHPSVIDACVSRFKMGIGSGLQTFYAPDAISNEHQFAVIGGDEDFIPFFDLQLLQGQNFTQVYAEKTYWDRNQSKEDELVILNETAVQKLGLTDPIGKRFHYKNQRQGRIIGVVKDFNFKSLHEPIEPLVLTSERYDYKYVYLKIRSDNLPETLAFLEDTWRKYIPSRAPIINFLDQDIDLRHYVAESRLNKIMDVFSGLAIFIACLGLFGLATFTAERKMREIGIRKVLGASIPQILGLLSKEFIVLVLIANLIAWPVAYYLMHDWLQNFAYRTNLSVGIFLLGSLFTLLIALITIWHQSLKAARINPVNTLRNE